MAAPQGFSLYQDVLGKKKTLQTLNPRELGLLATNFKDTDVGLGAERWIQSAPMSYWQQHMKPHPTAIWDAQQNLAPLPVTGASLLTPIYDPGAGWTQEQIASEIQKIKTGLNSLRGATWSGIDERTGQVGIGAPTGLGSVSSVQDRDQVATLASKSIQKMVTDKGLTSAAQLSLDELVQAIDPIRTHIQSLITAGHLEQAQLLYNDLKSKYPRLQGLITELEGRDEEGVQAAREIPSSITTGELTATDQRPFGATKIPDQLQAHLDDPSLAGVSSGDPSFDLAKLPPKKAVAEGAIDTSIDYDSYSPEWLQTLAKKGDEAAATYLRTKFPNWTGTDTSSIVDQFPAPEVRDFVADRTASDLLQTGASPTTEIQTEDFYEPPAEVAAVEEVSAIPDINYEAQTNEFLEGLAATDSEAAAVLANRDISPVEEEVVAPVDLTVETPTAPQTNWTQMTDAALSGAAMANNEGAIAEQGERNRLRQSINAWDDERLKRVVEGNYGVILNFGPKDPRYPMLQAYAQEELDKRAAAIPEEVIDTTTTLATPEEDIVTTEVDTVPEDTLLGQEQIDYTTLTSDQLSGQEPAFAKEKEIERRKIIDLLGYDSSDPEVMGLLTGLTFTDEQIKKISDDYKTYWDEYGVENLPTQYTQDFLKWSAGEGSAPDLAQFIATEPEAAVEVAAEPVPETEWSPPAPYIPTEPTEAITIDAVAEPVTYDRLDIPTAGGGTLPATSTTELAPYDPAKLPALSQISATIPGQRQVQAATGAEDMDDLARARRAYYEQYEAQPLLAQSEQERSALGRLRGQMMARQGLMGSPLGVGLGMQQEAQMRSLALQEVGRGRAAMELQLQEQRYLADQAAADRALQAGQFGVTAGLQQAELRLRQEELAGQQALQLAGLDIRQHEFATTTALAKSEQELRKEESDARVELDKLNMEIRQREFGTTTGLEMSDQELRRQQINAGLKVQQAEMAVSQKEFAASIGLQISQQELEKIRIDATERLNKSSLALEREQFGAEKGFRETEQDLQRQQFEATRDLGVANQLLQQKAYNADTKYRNDELAWRKAQAVIKEGLEIRQLDLEEERINATRDLEEADQALREQQFGAATAFQVTQADLEERRFQAQERLNKVDRDFRQSELDATMEMDQADQLFRDKQLGVTTGLQRAQLAIQERGLIFETESDRLDREFRERQLESSIGLEESQLGLSERQLEQNKLTQLSEQVFKENQLAQQLGLAVTDQELEQQQFKARLLQEESAQKFKTYEADASRHLAMMNLDLQQQTIKNNNDLQVAQQDLREEIQLFNVSEAGLQNYRSNEELRLKQDAHTVRIAELAASKENFEKQLKLQREIAEEKNKTARTGQIMQVGVAGGNLALEGGKALGWIDDGKKDDPLNLAMAGGGNADERAANQFADEVGGLGGVNMDAKVWEQAQVVRLAPPGNAQIMANAMDRGDLQLIVDKAGELEVAVNELMGQTAELGVNTALAGPETGESNVGMRPLTDEEKISYGEVPTLAESEVSKLGDNRSAIDRVAAEMYSTDTNSQSPKFGDATLPVAGSEVGPDYQKNQRQMVDQLIMMAGSSGEYDDNAMTAQLNKTDLKTLITAMATRTTLPFTLTKRQQVALTKLVGLPWFQAALKGGII